MLIWKQSAKLYALRMCILMIFHSLINIGEANKCDQNESRQSVPNQRKANAQAFKAQEYPENPCLLNFIPISVVLLFMTQTKPNRHKSPIKYWNKRLSIYVKLDCLRKYQQRITKICIWVTIFFWYKFLYNVSYIYSVIIISRVIRWLLWNNF